VITEAPGKVVISGAYSVLEGAPALVTAVSRYVKVDTARVGTFLTPEVRAAGMTTPVWFDASALRESDRKIGLGSSAAILVATLAANTLVDFPLTETAELRHQVFEPALKAHRKAQGGGSGIDVAASCFGGTLLFSRGEEVPSITSIQLPQGLVIEVWSSTLEASTSGLISKVKGLKTQDADLYTRLMGKQTSASEDAVAACLANSPERFIAALQAQYAALRNLGRAAAVSIVTEEVECLANHAARLGAAVIPAGAGGGDIALYVGFQPSTFLDTVLIEQKHCRLELTLGVEGVRALPTEPTH
jgi:phosphomevalonate kinase